MRATTLDWNGDGKINLADFIEFLKAAGSIIAVVVAATAGWLTLRLRPRAQKALEAAQTDAAEAEADKNDADALTAWRREADEANRQLLAMRGELSAYKRETDGRLAENEARILSLENSALDLRTKLLRLVRAVKKVVDVPTAHSIFETAGLEEEVKGAEYEQPDGN